ncbi:MAG: 3-isopropylmalate dehydrogenase [Acidimicrobiales bacterium]|jgi:3-isopropylmalate dehydrogenase|nr:3-isopropylmalate dehydrogenase [Acidimicrobiales bacterium]
MAYRVGIVGGDGIGPDVIAEGLKVIAAAGVELDTVDYDLGGSRYLRDGVVLTEEIVDEWRGLDAIYLGAVGTPDVPPGVIERGMLLRMRFELDLYINQRPFSLPSTHGSDPAHAGDSTGHEFIVIRENTEGTYAGEGGFLRKDTPQEIATQGSVNTRHGVERCIRYAFELAMTRRKHLTMVHKTNVLTFSGDLWDRTFNEVAADYPEVETAYNHVDAACIYFVDSPERYDVIVTDNLFGDILTDLGGAVSGGIGFASSANLHPGRVSMFEPVHGSAPDIAGQGIANPTAAVLSGALMLDHLGESDAADRIRAACADPDSLTGSTMEIGDLIVSRL